MIQPLKPRNTNRNPLPKSQPKLLNLQESENIPPEEIIQINPRNSFLDFNYIQRLQNLLVFNKPKAVFFHLGNNPIVTEENFVYIGHKGSKPYFCSVKNMDIVEPRDIEFSNDLKKICNGSIVEDVKKLGWIMIKGDKWGFLINKNTFEDVNQGKMPEFLQRLLKYTFFKKLNKNFASEDLEKMHYELSETICPIFQRLLPHQKKEVEWMFDLETNQMFFFWKDNFPTEPLFLGSNHCLDPSNSGKLVQKRLQCEPLHFPGRWLINPAGQGKTISMIGLITIGSQLNNKNTEVQYNGWSQKEFEKLREEINNRYDPTLVIVSSHVLEQWKEEFGKFAPDLRVFVLRKWGDVDNLKISKEGEEYLIKEYDVILTHRKMIEEGAKKFQDLCPEIFEVFLIRVVFDDFNEVISGYVQKENKENEYETIQWNEFVDCVTKFNRYFTWGLSDFIEDSLVENNLNDFGLLLNIDTKNCSDIQANNLKYNLRTWKNFKLGINKEPLVEIDLAIRRIFTSCCDNPLYDSRPKSINSIKEAKEFWEKSMADFGYVDDNFDGFKLAIKAIENKHQEEIIELRRKIENNDQEEQLKGLNERLKALEGKNNFFAEKAQILFKPNFDCPICFENIVNDKLVLLKCLHQICEDCYQNLAKENRNLKCPICKKFFMEQDFIMHPEYREEPNNKLTAILKAILETPPEDKIIIYAQFQFIIDKLYQMFVDLGISAIVFKNEESTSILKEFRTIAEIKVLLVSMEQKTNGLNITEANHVFFAHPLLGINSEKARNWYNQCIGNVYRIGQKKPVFVKLFLTKSNLENNRVIDFEKCFNR